MIKILTKMINTIMNDIHNRGLFITLYMNMSHFIGVLRGFWFKVIYSKNIKSTIFSLQSNSSIEIFNKSSRLYIGKFAFIRKNASIRIDFNGLLTIGDKVFLNDNCTINCVKHISIGKFTKIGPNVSINDHDHNYKNQSNGHLVKGEVYIGENVWIGSNVVIVRDTFIGDNAVIAAGSVVKGKVPANSLYLNKREPIIKPFTTGEKVREIL
ncbi:DapH/DapD/GlmU-related protein [Rossellomorea vietnamensis]|uniref:acyltransferase n=1 Tax=Rossellomorea vietnamensis TaxID=218284 RepID=UPI0009A8F29C|nr:galacturonic acid acetylase [Bacillus sp. DSM 27956]PRX75777.1 acetyltransferase-like isoleucine patch superfamily enzyme [Bacillus sp. V-88]WQI94229.1 acyltransferase [Rossellomorea vietnamensis]SLK23426.1 Acetyltransferase (isoleucine patch superfamily) [Bacillus sp. V-88]